MEPTFEKLLGKLLENSVDFILVGGLAVSLNGYVRLTEDVVILLALNEENLNRFISTMAAFGGGFGGELEVEDFIGDEPGAIRIVEESEECQIDVITNMGGTHYEDLVGKSESTGVAGHQLRYASKAQLIQLKSSSNREKDQIDISALKQLIDNPKAFD